MSLRPLIFFVLAAGGILAQNALFDAASVKPAPGRGAGALRGGPGTSSPGRLTGIVNMKTLVERAYEVKDYQISGPSWMDSERYEIVAKAPADATREQVPAMLRALLADRFHLAVHRENRQLPLLELVVAKNGPRLKEANPDDVQADETADTGVRASPKLQAGGDGLPELSPDTKLLHSFLLMVNGSDGVRIKRWARHETMQQLADDLSLYLNCPLLDRTNLKSQYDFTLDWAIESTGGNVPRVGPPPDEIHSFSGPIGANDSTDIFAAVSQLGLKLEQKRGTVEILVIDRADKVPTGN